MRVRQNLEMWRNLRRISNKCIHFSDLRDENLDPEEDDKAFIASVLVRIDDDDQENFPEVSSIKFIHEEGNASDENEEAILLVQKLQRRNTSNHKASAIINIIPTHNQANGSINTNTISARIPSTASSCAYLKTVRKSLNTTAHVPTFPFKHSSMQHTRENIKHAIRNKKKKNQPRSPL